MYACKLSIIVLIVAICKLTEARTWTHWCLLDKCRAYPHYIKYKDLLVKEDLSMLKTALRSVVNFVWKNHRHIDFIVYIGLFLASVHMKTIMTPLKPNKYYFSYYDSVRYDRIPTSLKLELQDIINTNDQSLHYFLASSYYVKKHYQLKKIINLFSNIDGWIAFSNRTFNQTWYPANFTYVGSQYAKLKQNIYSYGPENASRINECWRLIAESPERFIASNAVLNTLSKCDLKLQCIRLLNDFKYSILLSRSAMMYMLAYYSRMCYLGFNGYEDFLNYRELCRNIFHETCWHGNNRFPYRDVTFEHIAVCSFNVHADFFYRPWWLRLLSYQNQNGCFNATDTQKDKGIKDNAWVLLSDGNYDIMNGECNMVATSFAAAALAGALRFVIEEGVSDYYNYG